jgi:hypothetical protein
MSGEKTLQRWLGASFQIHRGLHGFDALASRSDGLIERGLEALRNQPDIGYCT